ncbi:MAG: HlyC/CorC family transporter [Chloroflexi bacterium]|nr:HlyC/CorC family transporter [Chloroflexota bacterium]
MDIFIRLAAVAILVFANAFFVAAEFALVSLRRSQVEQMAATGSRLGKMLLRAKENPNRFISAAQLGITMASLALGWIGELTIAQLVDPLFLALPEAFHGPALHSISVAISFAIITMLHIVLGEQVPKMVALQHAERTAMLTVGPTETFFRVFRPFIALFTVATDLALRLLRIGPRAAHEAAITADELELLIQTSHRAGVLEDTERDLLSNVFDFAQLAVRQVMVPRTEMQALPVDAGLGELLDLAEGSPHARFPVFEGTLDNIVGVAHLKDLLRMIRRGDAGFDLRGVLRPPLFVPESMPADRLLTEFKRAETTLAVVIDEYGGTAGLVTVEDLVEEIVGNLPDEFHRQREGVEPQPDGTTLVSPRLRVDEFSDLFEVPIAESQDVDTVGGLVVERLGRLAQPGDVVEVNDHQLAVEAVEGVRITSLRLIPRAQPKQSSVDADA